MGISGVDAIGVDCRFKRARLHLASFSAISPGSTSLPQVDDFRRASDQRCDLCIRAGGDDAIASLRRSPA
jgi:hypothetical protein